MTTQRSGATKFRTVTERPDAARRPAPTQSTTLLQLCEPLFAYFCQLNLSARKGAAYDYMTVRREVEDLLADIKTKANADPALVGMYDEQAELSLIFFIDNLMASAPLPFALDWSDNRIAYERTPAVMTGDNDFFRYFDEALADRSERGTQKLAVLYTCVGLGMTGENADRPEVLRRKMLEASRRLGSMMDSKLNTRICPDADEHTNRDNLIQPPVRPPVLIGITLLGLIVVLFVSMFMLYRDAVQDLTEGSRTIKATADGITVPGTR